MVRMIFFCIVTLIVFSSAQNRVLVRIGANGQQEAIPLAPGDRAQDVIARIENAKALVIEKATFPTGLTDSLKNYPGVANDATELTSNFGFTHQDVAFQWFTPQAYGKVKEVWWRNYSLLGDIKKATVRAWYANPKVNQVIPASVTTKYIGYYKDPSDGDGLVTPFKPVAGDQWFYKNGAADSTLFGYDPLGTEAPKWLPGGLQVELDSGKWQGIKLDAWGEDSMYVNLGQPFGFTISNDTKVTDIPLQDPVAGARMEILSYPNENPVPFHSYKFYETGRTSAADKGWYMRGDFEFGMYVVIEYMAGGCTPRVLTSGIYQTTLKNTPREICINVSLCDTISSVWLKYKIGSLSLYDSVEIVFNEYKSCVTLPAAFPGDTVYWRIIATDVKGYRTSYGPRSYVVFKKVQDNLLVYNNAQYSLGNTGANLIYTGGSSKYDRWSAPNDGIGEMDDLLALYNNVIIADGSFPSRDIYPSLKKWFEKGTAATKKNLFFSSQDYGCYITPACSDTTFAAGSFEFDYLGVSTLGTQDLGPTNRPYKVIPLADTVTNYLIKYNKDSSTTLWHYPQFELAFAAYPDAMVPKAGAKALFTDGAGINTLGVKNSGATFNSMFVAFDAGALQFRGDTSLHNAGYTTVTDPKYQWIADIGSLSNSFFNSVTNVNPVSEVIPGAYALGQNYPNPFNPYTTIEFSIPKKENVQIAVYNILGQKVTTVINETLEMGSHTVEWNAQPYASGLYFYEMRSGTFTAVKKMILMK